jgi:hypothetical protein
MMIEHKIRAEQGIDLDWESLKERKEAGRQLEQRLTSLLDHCLLHVPSTILQPFASCVACDAARTAWGEEHGDTSENRRHPMAKATKRATSTRAAAGGDRDQAVAMMSGAPGGDRDQAMVATTGAPGAQAATVTRRWRQRSVVW